MILEKVYDELYGMIEDLQKKIGKGGSVVTITPTLETGEKIADYSIDGTDGVLYAPVISDDYSATEEKIGTWTDGSDLYRKAVNCGNLPNNSSKNVAHEIQNLAAIVKIEGMADTGTSFAPLPFVSPTSDNSVMVTVTDTNIVFTTAGDRSGWTGHMIIYYTKESLSKTKKKK